LYYGKGVIIFKLKGCGGGNSASQHFQGDLKWIKNFIAETLVWIAIFWPVVRPRRKHLASWVNTCSPYMASKDFQRSSTIKHDQPFAKDTVTMEIPKK
jgi:hypothetical protein